MFGCVSCIDSCIFPIRLISMPSYHQLQMIGQPMNGELAILFDTLLDVHGRRLLFLLGPGSLFFLQGQRESWRFSNKFMYTYIAICYLFMQYTVFDIIQYISQEKNQPYHICSKLHITYIQTCLPLALGHSVECVGDTFLFCFSAPLSKPNAMRRRPIAWT